jgi:hypothetical protein
VRVRCSAWVGIASTIVVAALIVLPGAAAKPRGASDRQAAGMCAQERADLGKRAFGRKYGAAHPKRACLKATRRLINAASRIAAQDCQAELADLGAEDFVDSYGEDDTSTVDGAMAECIAETIDAILHPEWEIEDDPADGEA